MLTGFSIPIKVVQFLNFQQHVLKIATCTCKKLTKLKLTANSKLTCKQFIENSKKVGWKKMIHVLKNERIQSKWNQKSSNKYVLLVLY